MSDPSNDGPYICHGKMRQVDLLELTGVAETPGTAAWVCKKCGVWRHGFPRAETQLRAMVEAKMDTYLAIMVGRAR